MLRSGAYFRTGDGREPGALSLTSTRVVFEAGVGGPSPYTMYDEALERIWNVHAGTTDKFLEGRREFLTIEASNRRVVFEVPGAQHWAERIVRAKENAIPTPPPPPPPNVPPPPPGYGGHAPIVVNVQPADAPKIMMHCRHCGNLYDATKGRCDKCGAPPT